MRFPGSERPVGHLANICHHVDVGGVAPASIGAFRETYREGTILLVAKLVARGEIDAGLWKAILADVRAKKEVAGDLRAQISANRMGRRRLGALLDRYGRETLDFYIQPPSTIRNGGPGRRSRSCPAAPSKARASSTTTG